MQEAPPQARISPTNFPKLLVDDAIWETVPELDSLIAKRSLTYLLVRTLGTSTTCRFLYLKEKIVFLKEMRSCK